MEHAYERALCALLLSGTTAMADTVPNYTTWAFTGIVRNYDDTFSPVPVTVPPPALADVGVVPGALLTGFVTMDLDAPDGASEFERGQYAPVVAAKMDVGSLHMKFASSPINITVINNYNSSNVDDFFSNAGFDWQAQWFRRRKYWVLGIGRQDQDGVCLRSTSCGFAPAIRIQRV